MIYQKHRLLQELVGNELKLAKNEGEYPYKILKYLIFLLTKLPIKTITTNQRQILMIRKIKKG